MSTDILDQLSAASTELDGLEKKKATLTGKKQQLLKQLGEEFNFNTLSAARAHLNSLREENCLATAKGGKLLDELEELINPTGGSDNE